MKTHTPGPWRTRTTDEEAPDDTIVMDADGASICDCLPGNPRMSQETAEANARLCAAAPDLLEACFKAERKLLAYLGVCAGDKQLSDDVLPAIRGAIQKARG